MPPDRARQRGQALPLFGLLFFVLTGSVAIVTDVSWFWVSNQHMQRAADAGALAGAVFLPGNPAGARRGISLTTLVPIRLATTTTTGA